MRTFILLFTALLLSLTFNSNAQYCLLQGRTIYSPKQPGITNFKLSNIDRNSSNVEFPLNQPSMVVTKDTATLERGKTYTVTISHSRDDQYFPNARNNIRVWIDYDHNQDFTDAGETVITKDFETPGTTYTASFTVPTNAPLGYTRLRATAKMSSDAGHTTPTPCDVPKDPLDYHGEMEDYTIKVVEQSTSITNVDLSNEVRLYPNPTNNRITLSFERNNKPTSILLLDITGKKIATLSNSISTEKNTVTFMLNDYIARNGIYIIKIKSDNYTTYKRVFKNK